MSYLLRYRRAVRNWSPGTVPPRCATVPNKLPPPEWRILLRHHPNVLLEGRESDIDATLVALGKDFYPQVIEWGGGAPARPADAVTLIVREIARCTATQHAELSRWLDAGRAPVQVISTSSVPVFPLVERGIFPSDLYFRLNTIRLTLG